MMTCDIKAFWALKAFTNLILLVHKGIKASAICKVIGICITVKALYNLHQMITSFFLHDVFADIIKLQTRTPTAVNVKRWVLLQTASSDSSARKTLAI